MEIKKREIIFSIIIVAVMLIIGFAISGKIQIKLLDNFQKYDTATRIETEELFRYGMSTNIGHSFVYGNLRVLDPVGFPELKGEYSYIKKEQQEYTRHSRTVTKTYTDSKGNTKTRTEVEYYWTWDTVKTYTKTSKKITFLNVEFEYKKIPFPIGHLITTIETGFHTRNVYYGTETEFTGTIFTNLKENTISDTSFYKNQTIEETINHLETGYELIIFWVIWVIIIAGLVIAFYFLENKWLD